MNPKQEVDPGEAARILGVAIGTLANWRTQGVGPEWRKRRPYRNAPIAYHRARLIRWGKAHGYIEA